MIDPHRFTNAMPRNVPSPVVTDASHADASRTDASRTEADLRIRAGRAVRDLGHALVGHQADGDALAVVAEQLEALTARLATGEKRQRPAHSFQRGADWSPPGEGEAFQTTHDDRPVSGRSSPYSLDPEIHREGDEVIATITLRAAHEGAPARSHGGIVAALFDDVFGFVLAIHQTPGFTGELGIRYEAGTPLHVPLTCRVRLAERQGRKLFMSGELTTTDGTVCVRATATFIAIDPARLAWGDGV
jgi:acyl-coenzyme A thioesterase PaaI-like protein